MTERLLPTPSQTIGPFYGHALPFPDGGQVASQGHPEAITLHGYVFDGAGEVIPDALLDFWQAAPDGSLEGAPGSLRRDPSTGGFLGRNGLDFTGFGRVATDADGRYALHTLPPGNAGLPYISVCVIARGLVHHLFTRAYLADGADLLLDSLPADRRATLIAAEGANRTYRFDIRLQGEGETVFLEFQ
ncbi:protocatechuate 3,4-dioxygenase subunit alpha [Streptomyces mirabilis]|uniref:protocatechuate 3,4-dioxygenase subunit alpha n=1 Tax=Streptomyces mirabilis TaxID=68239 RepID=UPI0036CD418E